MNRSSFPLLCAILLCSTPSFAQSGTLDQSAVFGNASFNGQASLVWQIEVKAGMDGTLEGFYMMLQGAPGLTIDFAVRRGSGWNTSPILFQGTTTLAGTGSWELHFVDATSASISHQMRVPAAGSPSRSREPKASASASSVRRRRVRNSSSPS